MYAAARYQGLGEADPSGWTPSQALEWLKSRARKILKLEARIVDLQHKAALLAGRAREAGRPELEEQAKDAIRALGQLNQAWTPVADRLQYIFSEMGLAGIPVPAYLAGAVVATATAAYLLIRKVNQQDQLLQLVEDGVISAEEAQGISRAGWLGSAERLGKLLVAGLALGATVRIVEAFRG